MTSLRKQAGHQLSVGRNPDSRATGTERLGNRGYDAEIPFAICEGVIDRGRASVIAPLQLEWVPGPDDIEDFALGYHFGGLPVIRVAHIHILDEPDCEVVLARKLDEIENLVVVDAPLDHGIDLDWMKPVTLRRGDSLEHRR